MRFLKFWALAESKIEVPKYGILDLKKWAGSDVSKEDAKRLAQEAVLKLAEKVRLKPVPELGHYGYDTDAIREELLEEKTAEGKTLYAISRNRYGSLVLNSPDVFFADIDGTNRRGWLESLRWRFGSRPPQKAARSWRESKVIEKLETFFKNRPQCSGRLYFTARGMRLLLTHEPYSPDAADTKRLLQELDSDPLYVRLCEKQKCFRARLTPKPWRLKLGLPPGSFPRESEDQQRRFREWLSDYDRQSGGYAACKFVTSFGSSRVGTQMSELVDAHDKWTKASSELPLA